MDPMTENYVTEILEHGLFHIYKLYLVANYTKRHCHSFQCSDCILIGHIVPSKNNADPNK